MAFSNKKKIIMAVGVSSLLALTLIVVAVTYFPPQQSKSPPGAGITDVMITGTITAINESTGNLTVVLASTAELNQSITAINVINATLDEGNSSSKVTNIPNLAFYYKGTLVSPQNPLPIDSRAVASARFSDIIVGADATYVFEFGVLYQSGFQEFWDVAITAPTNA
jgi:hypothetical protein